MGTLTKELKIDKEVLEANVVTATSKNNDVFEMLAPFIEEIAESIKDNVLGEPGYKAIASDDTLLQLTQRVVCREAFAENISSLDLVLTATGFGIVSTQDTAPASQARVQALQTQVTRQYLKSLGVLIDYLRKIVEGWGETAQAEANINNVFYDFNLMVNFCSQKNPTLDDWLNAQIAIRDADMVLRREISDEEMNDLLSRIRHNDITNAVQKVIYCARVITAELINQNTTGALPKLVKRAMDRIFETMENNIEDFEPYKNSSEYKARHEEPYANTKDSPVYFWG